jgi:ATP-dependent RNA helicase DHX29
MARKKKVAAKRDVRGYQQGPSKQQQPAAAAAVVSRSASSLGTASDAAVRAVPLTASTQQDLETLLETLLHINNASNNQGDSSSTLATAPQAVQSDRFFKRMATVYDRLTQLGFTLDQIVQAVVALGYEITLESALDWLCLHLSTQELPPLFTEGQIRESETAASSGMADPLTVLPATARPVSIDAQQEHVLLTTDFATNPQFQSAKESASANLQEKDEDDKAAQKTWLLQQYEYVADDEQDIGLNDVIRDEMDTANATTRRKERSLATPLATLEPAVDAAAINESSANAVDNVADPVTVAEPTVQEMQLQALQEELRQLEADLKDEAALYMLSKYEVKELQKRTKNLRKQVQGMQRKVEKQRVQSRQNQVAVLSKVVSMDQVDDAADEGEEVETGGMSSMFEEEQAPQEPLQPATNDTTLQDADDGNAVDIPKDSIPKSWTGKTPREILQDWCRKQKLQRPMYQKLSRNGCSIRVKLGPSNIVYLEQRGPYPSYVDTQEYMATKALFDINPDLPLYRIFPPFHRDIWRTWVDSNKQEKDNKAQEGKDQRSETIDMLIKSIPVAQASSIKPSSNTAISRTGMSKARDEAEEELDSWEGHDERLEPESWEDNDDTGDDRLLSQERERAPTAVDERLRKSFLARQLTAGYKDMLQLRSSLPMYLYREEILGCIRKNPVTILYAETGAGKTTQCPQFVLEQALLDGKGSHTSILCTQPRRVAAMSVAERVADEMCEESIGKLVGYQIRLEARRSSATRLLFCTTGIILRRLVEDPELRGISHVVVDEVHERQWQIDVLLVALRNLLNGARPDLKVVLMSATLDSKLFTKFFNGAPLISVPGRTFPVTQYYLEDLLDAADHIIEEGSRCARRQRDNRETASLFVSTRGGEKRRETVSLDSELDTDLSDEFVGYKMATRRQVFRLAFIGVTTDAGAHTYEYFVLGLDRWTEWTRRI